MAQAKTIAAYSYKKSIGQPRIYPRTEFSYAANFLRMMFSVPAEDYEIDENTLNEKIFQSKKILFKEREKRVKPGLDDKILTSWNALMISRKLSIGYWRKMIRLSFKSPVEISFFRMRKCSIAAKLAN
jgi:hypothetical protein